MAVTRPRSLLPALLTALLGALSCGDDAVEPDLSLADLVGSWEASAMVLTPVADPSASVDVIDFGASFFLDVQPSGGYTSTLAYRGFSASELGHLEVEGDLLIFVVQIAPTGPRMDTARFELQANRLELEGRTVFDFDFNGIGEAAEVEATLLR